LVRQQKTPYKAIGSNKHSPQAMNRAPLSNAEEDALLLQETIRAIKQLFRLVSFPIRATRSLYRLISLSIRSFLFLQRLHGFCRLTEVFWEGRWPSFRIVVSRPGEELLRTDPNVRFLWDELNDAIDADEDFYVDL